MWDDSSEGYADMLINPDALMPLWAAVTLFEVGFEFPQGYYPILCYPCFNQQLLGVRECKTYWRVDQSKELSKESKGFLVSYHRKNYGESLRGRENIKTCLCTSHMEKYP